MKIDLRQNQTTSKQLFSDFLVSCKARGLSEKTIQSYESHMRCIGKYLDLDTPLSDLQKKEIDRMIAKMRDKGLSANTIASYIRVLNAFLSWGREDGLTNLKIAPYKGVEVIKDTYTDEELKLLLRKPNMKKCTFEEYRNWVIINLLLDCGCRAATVIAIENKDVDLTNGPISYLLPLLP